MAFRFADSFDHYAATDILKKYNNLGGTGTPTIETGLNGSCLRRGNYNQTVYLQIDSQATWIVGMRFRAVAALPAGNRGIIGLYENATCHTALVFKADGTLQFYRGGFAGTALGSASSTALSPDTWYYIEAKVTINNTTGVAVCKINGTTEVNLSSQDTQNGGTAFANLITLGNENNSDGADSDHDDLYILDGTDGTASQGAANNDFWGDVRVEGMFVNGAGNSAQFTPLATTNDQMVDEAQADGDTSYNASSTSGHIDSFSMTNVSAASGSILGVQSVLMARKDDAGTRALQPHFRISSTNYAGTSVNLTDSYLFRREIYGKSPASGSAWTISELNGAEFGYKIP